MKSLASIMLWIISLAVKTNRMEQKIKTLCAAHKAFYATEVTRDVKWRREQLKTFKTALAKWEKKICDALWTDLHKSYEEAYITEISIVAGEIDYAIRHVASWSKREWKKPVLAVLPSMSYVVKEPLGTALIVSPWNYPVQLLLCPLVGAIAAGCTAVLKPSPYVPHVSQTIADMMADTFPEEYVAVVQGNREVNRVLFDQPFALIFYTGSPAVAHTVMEAAARHLTPVVLELGGKSPCIIDRTANIPIAAKRLAWAKTLNSGQTCIAPDYILIHPEVKQQFIEAFTLCVHDLHGRDIQKSRHYVRMVSDRAFERVASYLDQGKIVSGGHTDAAERYIEPTLLDEVSADAPVMQEEIFGPVFPLITMDGDFQESVVNFVNARPKPLALYYYGKQDDGWALIRRTSSGGACINDSVMHIVNTNMPFGGVGHSGMGRYHRRETFEAFSHTRSVLVSPRCWDLPFRYMPYRLFALVKHLV